MSVNSFTMVCRNDNPNSIQNARQLSILVTEKDDADDASVGTHDGSVSEINVLTEQEFEDRSSHPLNDKIIFIGHSAIAEQYLPSIPDNFNQFGIHYGWAGDFAFIYVDDELLDEDTYSEFVSFAKGRNIELEDIYVKQEQFRLEHATHRAAATTSGGALACIGVMTLPIALPVAAVLIPAGAAAMLVADRKDSGLTKHEMQSSILAQQHAVAIELFYLDELQRFMA